jgi:hypothetical protein
MVGGAGAHAVGDRVAGARRGLTGPGRVVGGLVGARRGARRPPAPHRRRRYAERRSPARPRCPGSRRWPAPRPTGEAVWTSTTSSSSRGVAWQNNVGPRPSTSRVTVDGTPRRWSRSSGVSCAAAHGTIGSGGAGVDANSSRSALPRTHTTAGTPPTRSRTRCWATTEAQVQRHNQRFRASQDRGERAVEVSQLTPGLHHGQGGNAFLLGPSRILAAVRAQGPMGEHLEAFFGCMYYAALRPGEVVALGKGDTSLPAAGWGELALDLSDPPQPLHSGRTTALGIAVN